MQIGIEKVGRRLGGALEILHKIGLYLAVLATLATMQAIELNYQDIRAISVPLVILTGPIAVCFTLMAAEFLRQAFVAKNDGE